jgi:hypothetical protein
MGEHAFLSCSGAGAWVKCAAYPSVAAKFPEVEESEEAMRGTAAHWVLENVLELYKKTRTADYDSWLGQSAPSGIIIDQEIIDGVSESVNDVVITIGNKEYLWDSIYLEMPLVITRVHPTHCWGTADIVIVDNVVNRIYILDFKFGHVYVEPWFNWQLILYAIGAVDKFFPGNEERVTLHLNTLQPRSFSNAKSPPWKLLATDLRGYANQALTAAEKALLPNPLATTGPHCTHCPGRHACSAYTRALENCLDFSEIPTTDLPSAAAVGVELQMIDRALDILGSRRVAIVVLAECLMAMGKDVPGYKMESGTTALKWNKDKEEILQLGKLLKIDLAKPLDCITPTQAVAKGVNAQLIKKYAEKLPTGFKLKKHDTLTTLKIFKRGTLI